MIIQRWLNFLKTKYSKSPNSIEIEIIKPIEFDNLNAPNRAKTSNNLFWCDFFVIFGRRQVDSIVR